MKPITLLKEALLKNKKDIQAEAKIIIDELNSEEQHLLLLLSQTFSHQQNQNETVIESSKEKDLVLFEEIEQYIKNEAMHEKVTPLIKGTVIDSELEASAQNLLKLQKRPIKDKNRYQVLKTLGEGGMGVVQLVQDHLLKREVALKKIKLGMKATQLSQLTKAQQMMLWRLHREAEITAVLEHPNIVPLYDMQQIENGELQFTMRKVEGSTLRVLLKSIANDKEKDKESYLLSIFLKVCDAVAYAHAQGIIHRDLKPDNIMVGQFGEVYVMDWGIAKKYDPAKLNQESKSSSAKEQISQNGKEFSFSEKENITFNTLGEEIERTFQDEAFSQEELKTIGGMGTEGYMPFEQQTNAALVTPTADIFALGKILRECFTYLSPLEELRQKIKKETWHFKKTNALKDKKREWLSDFKVPADIQAIVEKATNLEKESRYPKVSDLVEDIERYQKNLWVSAREFTFYDLLESLIKWSRRNKQSLILFAIVLSLSLGFPFYFKWKRKKEIAQNQLVEKRKEQKEFETYWKSSQQVRENWRSYSVLEKNKDEGQSEKLKQLLFALNDIKKALALRPNHQEAKQTKFDIGKALVILCCETKDYQFASYIAEELQSPVLRTQVQNEERKLLENHKARLHYWKNRFLKKEHQAWEKEEALFEITKMTEEEIFEELLTALNEGADYFISAQQSIEMNELYLFIADVFGRLENNRKAGDALMGILTKMGEKVALIQDKERNEGTMKYMISLIRALANSKDIKHSQALQTLRFKMGNYSKFWDQTRQSYKKLLSAGPQEKTPLASEKAYYDRGLRNVVAEDFEAAIQDFTQGIKLAPKASDCFIEKGKTYLKLGKPEQAVSFFTAFLKDNPKNSKAYLYRGIAKSQRKDFDGALLDFDIALKETPVGIDYYNFRAKIYNQRGLAKQNLREYVAAYEDFQKATKLCSDLTDPKINKNLIIAVNNREYSRGYNNRGYVCMLLRNSKLHKDFIMPSARSSFKSAILIDSENIKAYINLATADGIIGAFDVAIESADKAITLNPKAQEAYRHRGTAKWQKGDFAGGLLDYHYAIKLNPKDYEAYKLMGIAYHRTTKLDKAIQAFENSLEINSQQPGVAMDLANILIFQMRLRFKEKEYEKVKEYLLKFKKYAPSNHPQLRNFEKMWNTVEEQVKKNK